MVDAGTLSSIEMFKCTSFQNDPPFWGIDKDVINN